MRKDKEIVFKLRQEGKSYRQIQKETGISRSTLTSWFKDITWSKHQVQQNRKKNIELSKDRVIRMNMVRNLKLQYQYALVESEAVREYQENRKDPLFWAGLMIYAGEGDKRTKHQIRVSSSQFYIHRIFMDFSESYLKIPKSSFKIGLLLYPGLDEKECLNAWKQGLNITDEYFYKTHVLQGKEGRKRLQYGIGMSIITNTSLKKKLLKWLLLAEEEQFTSAVIV